MRSAAVDSITNAWGTSFFTRRLTNDVAGLADKQKTHAENK
jgi:hypothetical protein